MKFPVALTLAFMATAYGQKSSSENAFTLPPAFAPRAGEEIQVTWKPTTTGTISLYLRSGSSNNLTPGVEIANAIQNSGSYSWNVDSGITRGSDYTLEIRSADGLSNYSRYFVIESNNTVASTTNPSTTGTATRTESSTSSSSGSVSVTLTSASESTTHTGSSTHITTHITTTATNSSSSAGFQSTGGNSTSVTRATGAAPRATAVAGLVGAVAMAALAL